MLPSDHSEMLHGIHCALLVPAAMTVLSAILFRKLKAGDGDHVSQHGETAGGRGNLASRDGLHFVVFIVFA